MSLESHRVAHDLMNDPVAYARVLSRTHDDVLSGSAASTPPRQLIVESWHRSLAARVNPDEHRPPVVYDQPTLREWRAEHRLAPALPVLRQTLLSIADEAVHVMIVTDSEGLILWCEGNASVLNHADEVGLSAGTRWSESVIGTNAMGTTLAVDRPVQVHSAEHLVRTYHDWTCAAAPIHDPDTGRVIGAVDIRGPLWTIHPATVALVAAAASLAEERLRAITAERDQRLLERNRSYLDGLRGRPGALLAPGGRVLAAAPAGHLPPRIEFTPEVAATGGDLVLPDGRAATLAPLNEGYLLSISAPTARTAPKSKLELAMLGDAQPTAVVDGRRIDLALRHAEIIAVLAMHPEGLGAERLALALYGEEGNPITVRSEIYRLRTELGRKIIAGKPYRIDAEVRADFLTARDAVREGRLDAATGVYRGELLPSSEAPAVREERDSLTATLRGTALAAGHLGALWRFAQYPPGKDDDEVLVALLDGLDSDDHRRHWASARLRALRSGEHS